MADLIPQVLVCLVGTALVAAMVVLLFRPSQRAELDKAIEAQLSEVRTRVFTDSAAHHQRLDGMARSTSNIESAIQLMSREIIAIKTSTDAGSYVAVQASIEGLRSSYEKLHSEVSGLSGEIVREFNDQQQHFIRNIQMEFARAVESSKTGLEQALVKEIAPLVPSVQQQKIIIEKLMDLSGYAMLAMGKYQLQVVEAHSSKAVEETGIKVTDSMRELKADVEEVQKHLDEIPKLPALYR